MALFLPEEIQIHTRSEKCWALEYAEALNLARRLNGEMGRTDITTATQGSYLSGINTRSLLRAILQAVMKLPVEEEEVINILVESEREEEFIETLAQSLTIETEETVSGWSSKPDEYEDESPDEDSEDEYPWFCQPKATNWTPSLPQHHL